MQWEGDGCEWTAQYSCHLEVVLAMLSGLPMASISDDRDSLDDLFDRLYDVPSGVRP